MLDLEAKAAEWNVALEEVRETPSSVIGFGMRDGKRVVLKITTNAADESHSGKVLAAYDGDGAVTVYEHETGAVLIERLEPGNDLVEMVRRGRDEEATKILAAVISKLANHEAPVESPTVADWGRGFDSYLHSGDRQIPHELVREAGDLYQKLSLSQGQTMLLHGDLQHYNILFDRRRGWVAIDPKGVVGELEYEVGPMLRNPGEVPEICLNPATIKRRLDTLTTSLHLDYARTLRWSFAQAVLSAIWGVEDGYEIRADNPSLLLARELKKIFSTLPEKGADGTK